MPVTSTHSVASVRGWASGVVANYAQKEKITPTGPIYIAGSLFGYTLKLDDSGNKLIVGSPNARTAGSGSQGQSALYINNGTSYVSSTVFQGSQNDANFGRAVTISPNGNVCATGSPYWDGTYIDQGFTLINDISTLPPTVSNIINSPNPVNLENFGESVALSNDGNTLVVGAPGANDINNAQGAAYIFTRSGGSWVSPYKLVASDGATGDYFGFSVSISADGNTILVGAPYKSSERGSAYIYVKNGSNWNELSILVASDGVAGDRFGHSVTLNSVGTLAIIGARSGDGVVANSGTAYIFKNTGGLFGSWAQEQEIMASDGVASAFFGWSVAINTNSNIIVVGAPFTNSAVYIFTLNGTTWTQNQKISKPNTQDEQFGHSVSISANGNILAVGTTQRIALDTGAVYIFSNS